MSHDLQDGEQPSLTEDRQQHFFESNLTPNQLHQLVNFNIKFNVFIR